MKNNFLDAEVIYLIKILLLLRNMFKHKHEMFINLVHTEIARSITFNTNHWYSNEGNAIKLLLIYLILSTYIGQLSPRI